MSRPKRARPSVIPATVAVDFVYGISVKLSLIEDQIIQLMSCWARIERMLHEDRKPRRARLKQANKIKHQRKSVTGRPRKLTTAMFEAITTKVEGGMPIKAACRNLIGDDPLRAHALAAQYHRMRKVLDGGDRADA